MSNSQFLTDGLSLLKGKVNTEKLQKKLDIIAEESTDDYAVDELERILKSNGFDVYWGEGYRIV